MGLTKKQARYILFFCITATLVSLYIITKAPYVEAQTDSLVVEPITITPLDSPNPCWDPHFWSRVE
jgi:hypothetical protein